jgi:hypothetical protein
MQANILLLISYIRHKVLFEIPHPYSLYRHQWPKLTCGLSWVDNLQVFLLWLRHMIQGVWHLSPSIYYSTIYEVLSWEKSADLWLQQKIWKISNILEQPQNEQTLNASGCALWREDDGELSPVTMSRISRSSLRIIDKKRSGSRVYLLLTPYCRQRQFEAYEWQHSCLGKRWRRFFIHGFFEAAY